ncbi:protein tilB homolog isoform X2 [Camponotus floridanus]|uniref:protein tilB homolog isoform X2 n=1 Tax=Camponotus floridanus TaxID=104421 RepID=UPI00059CA5EF|nr:protein tilB homolog isoform X2 [Camponotus floridanus]
MVKLTEEMVVARTRVSDFSAVKKLNCWGTELTDVSILRKMINVEVLSLSINNINTLADFQCCHKLQDLFIRRNNIKDLNEICYLQGLPNLRNLWLGENPCAEKEGYRLAVLRALPNLEKLDDKVVLPEEVQTAMAIGRPLIHPLEMDASPQSDAVTPERSFDETQHTHEEYDPDRRNANYSASSSHHYSQNNQYAYELQNGQSKNQSKDDSMCTESRSNNETVATNTLEISKDYDDRPAVRHNGDYDERRAYSEYGGNEVSQRIYTPTSQRTQYAVNELADDRRNDRNNYSYDERTRVEYEDSPQPPIPQRRMAIHHNEREDGAQVPGWVRHSEKDKCRTQFHYHRRPVTRNSNILSAVLCLVKELDYPSLEVVEMAVRNRMDELEE